MDMKQFIQELDKLGYDIVTFNTFRHFYPDASGDLVAANMYYIMVAGRGESGTFFRKTGAVITIDTDLAGFLQSIKLIKAMPF